MSQTEKITLKSIKASLNQLTDQVAAFEAGQIRRAIDLKGRTLVLELGEHYAGVILGAEGSPDYDLILIDGEANDITWEGAKEWAHEAGGQLPDRREQSLLYANLKEKFQGAWYWSSEQLVSDESFAWLQDFGNGLQGYDHKHDTCRARAVRRSIIK